MSKDENISFDLIVIIICVALGLCMTLFIRDMMGSYGEYDRSMINLSIIACGFFGFINVLVLIAFLQSLCFKLGWVECNDKGK
jgi:hypothetical protein